jgi:uridine kinase
LIYKPLVIFDEDRITTEELDTTNTQVLIAEGTYTSLLQFVDFRIFIDRDYRQTLEARLRRARDKFEPFVMEVLEKEHQIISKHKSLADAVVSPDFNQVHNQE